MSSSGIIYASFDRFPAPKGAAVHIRAFVEALSRAFGGLDLLAIGGEAGEPPPGGYVTTLLSSHQLIAGLGVRTAGAAAAGGN